MEEINTNNMDEKIDSMSKILEEIVTDTNEFIQDMNSGIIMYYLMGIMTFLTGILNIWSNRIAILNGDSLYLIFSIALIVSGPIIAYQGLRLRIKYCRLFEARKQLISL